MPSISTPEPPTAARRVGIVGPGLMGLGIAQAVAASGSKVVLCGRSAEAAQAGRRRLTAALEREVARGRLEAAASDEIVGRVEAAESDDELGGCEIVIESVDEDREHEDAGAAPDRSRGAARNDDRQQHLGPRDQRARASVARHRVGSSACISFRPPPAWPWSRSSRGEATSADCVRSALAFIQQIGKRPVLVRDGPGFFATRVFAAYLDEALAMLSEGVAPQLIEAAAIANGRALGPLAMLDETGLALNLQQARQARADGLEPRFCRPLAEPVLARMAELGRGGRRNGGGFFDWPADGPRTVWPGLASAFPLRIDQPDGEAVKLRLLSAEAREALHCLEEGVIASADDGDAASVLGLGFPKRVGGILRWTEDFGLAAFVTTCDTLAHDNGARFAPSPWLRDLAERGEGLARWRAESKQRSEA